MSDPKQCLFDDTAKRLQKGELTMPEPEDEMNLTTKIQIDNVRKFSHSLLS